MRLLSTLGAVFLAGCVSVGPTTENVGELVGLGLSPPKIERLHLSPSEVFQVYSMEYEGKKIYIMYPQDMEYLLAYMDKSNLALESMVEVIKTQKAWIDEIESAAKKVVDKTK